MCTWLTFKVRPERPGQTVRDYCKTVLGYSEEQYEKEFNGNERRILKGTFNKPNPQYQSSHHPFSREGVINLLKNETTKLFSATRKIGREPFFVSSDDCI